MRSLSVSLLALPSFPVPRLHAAVLIAAAVALSAGAARAQEDQRAEARRHYERALELADEGAYAEAVVEFTRAHELSPHHAVLYNLGQAYVALGKPVEAADTLRHYLVEGGKEIPAARRAQVEQEIRRQEARIAAIAIETNVSGAVIRVDGTEVGKTPLPAPVRVGIGSHRVAASLDGYRPAEQSVAVAGEEKARIAFTLEKVEAGGGAVAPGGGAGAGAGAAGGPGGSIHLVCAQAGVEVEVDGALVGRTPLPGPLSVPMGAHDVVLRAPGGGRSSQRIDVAAAGAVVDIVCDGTGGIVAPQPQPLPPPQSGNGRRIAGFVLGGIGIVAGGAAIGHFVWNKGRYDDWVAEDAKLHGSMMSSYYTDERQRTNNALAEAIGRASVVTVSLGVGAGLFLATGILLVATAPSEPAAVRASGAPGAPVSAVLGLGVGPGFVTWRGSF